MSLLGPEKNFGYDAVGFSFGKMKVVKIYEGGIFVISNGKILLDQLS